MSVFPVYLTFHCLILNFSQRTMDMRLMAEHKYGLRVTANLGWQDFFRKLGEAAVILHMLENKPQHTTTVKLKTSTSSQNKGKK